MKEVIEYTANRILGGFQAKYGAMDENTSVTLKEVFEMIKQQEQALIHEIIAEFKRVENITFGDLFNDVRECNLEVEEVIVCNTNRNYIYDTPMYNLSSLKEAEEKLAGMCETMIEYATYDGEDHILMIYFRRK